jgi:putative transposase
VALAMGECAVSERRACKLLEMDRSSYRYEPQPDRNAVLRQELIELARQKPRYGYRRLGVLLGRRGYHANHQRLYRLYCQEHRAVRRLKRKRLARPAVPVAMLSRAKVAADDAALGADLLDGANGLHRVGDRLIQAGDHGLATGRARRLLTMVDNYTRECPAIEVDSCLSSQRVTRVLERVIE